MTHAVDMYTEERREFYLTKMAGGNCRLGKACWCRYSYWWRVWSICMRKPNSLYISPDLLTYRSFTCFWKDRFFSSNSCLTRFNSSTSSNSDSTPLALRFRQFCAATWNEPCHILFGCWCLDLLYSFLVDEYPWSRGSVQASSRLNSSDDDCTLRYSTEWCRRGWVEFHSDGAGLHPVVLDSWSVYSIDDGKEDAYCFRHARATTKKGNIEKKFDGEGSWHTFSNFVSIICASKRLSLSRVVDSLYKRTLLIEFVAGRCLPPTKTDSVVGDFHCCCYSSNVHRLPRHWTCWWTDFHEPVVCSWVMRRDASLNWKTSFGLQSDILETTENSSTRSLDCDRGNGLSTGR